MRRAAGRQEFERAALLRDALAGLGALAERQSVLGRGSARADVIALAFPQEASTLRVAVGLLRVEEGEVRQTEPHLVTIPADDLPDRGDPASVPDPVLRREDRAPRADLHRGAAARGDRRDAGRAVRLPGHRGPIPTDRSLRGARTTRRATRACDRRPGDSASGSPRGTPRPAEPPVSPDDPEPDRRRGHLDLPGVGGGRVPGGVRAGAAETLRVPSLPDPHRSRDERLRDDRRGRTRRYLRRVAESEILPDLLLIDGGAGQLSAALASLSALNLTDRIP